jgi:hypothetical protein
MMRGNPESGRRSWTSWFGCGAVASDATRRHSARTRLTSLSPRFAANVLPIVKQIRASGVTSLRAIAKALNARGVATARGGIWTPVQVTAVLRRASAQTEC